MFKSLLAVLTILLLITCLAACGGQSAGPSALPAADPALTQQINALPAPPEVDRALWGKLTAELSRVLSVTASGRTTSAPPSDELSKVTDLQVAPAGGGSALFNFSYRCTGDYDQNGEVNIADLTPIGVHFGKNSASADWAAARVADGDANGEINIADITPIGVHYMTRVSGFQLEMADAPDAASWQSLTDITLTEGAIPAAGGFREYGYTLAAPTDGKYYRVAPFEPGTPRLLGIPSNPVFFTATMLPAPQNVQASDGIYPDRVSVTWTKVSAATGYWIYRDSQTAPLTQLGDVDTFDDTALADYTPHTYWIKASDGTEQSNFSASDSGFRKEPLPGELLPPTAVHASDGDFEDHILIGWGKALNATGYKVYRDTQANLVATVGNQAYYDDYDVTDVFQHTYWVSSIDATDESALSVSDTGYRAAPPDGTMVVLAWNDLGMHCMNQDFSELMILPPYNVLHAQVIDRTHGSPEIVTQGVTVRYTIPENTHSADKCNFWDYVEDLLGAAVLPDIGLTGNGMAGTLSPLMATEIRNDWSVTGIPITPINDAGEEDAYNLATVTVETGGNVHARTQAVVPVSWEISCDLCHVAVGKSVATDILEKHDAMHATNLVDMKPVLCGNCHAQPPLGTAGLPGLASLSGAMHTAHAPRMTMAGLENECYACHPGQRTQCLRDVMFAAGLSCQDCHGTMADVGAPTRSPWADEPRCDSCHTRAGFEFEQPATLYRNSVGHNGVHCAACHGSPHAITPTIEADDNVQAIALQGHSGKIDTCSVCHSEIPGDPFNHTVGEWGGGDD